MAGNNSVDGRLLLLFGCIRCRDNNERMLRAIHAGTQHLGHTAVDLEKVIAVFPGAGPVLDRGNHAASIGDQIRPRLDFQSDSSARRFPKGHKSLDHRLADLLQVG